MKPEGNQYFHCPNCKSIISRGTLISGNTFGQIMYSDVKTIAPMLPEFPAVVVCEKCKALFWLSSENFLGDEDNGFFPAKDKELFEASFLSAYEYKAALDRVENPEDSLETYVRIRMWWWFNDRVREGSELFQKERDIEIWEDNVNKLLQLLDRNYVKEMVMIAEINRNFGRFEKCMQIIDSISDKNAEWVKTHFERECTQKNVKLFKLYG